LDDPFGKELLKDQDRDSPLHPYKRNKSVLIHGFKSLGEVESAALKEKYRELERPLEKDNTKSFRNNLSRAKGLL